MLQLVGGIFGILGCLLGLFSAFLSVSKGLAPSTDPTIAMGSLAVGIIVGLCTVICLPLSIWILNTGRRMAGVLMIPPALVGTILTYGLMATTLKGAILTAIWGESQERVENYETRQSRLEREVQQRYGARS